MVLDYLPIPDLLRVARTSRRMREMVYDDTRWIARLRAMGCWNEAEARAQFEETVQKRLQDQRQKDAESSGRGPMGGGTMPGPGRPRKASTTLFDSAQESERLRRPPPSSIEAGFDAMTLGAGGSTFADPANPYGDTWVDPAQASYTDPTFAPKALASVRSHRGHARQEFGRVYGALAPLWNDLLRAQSHNDPAIFRTYREPEDQAAVLSGLTKFIKGADWALGWQDREEKLTTIVSMFEKAALREFERGIEQCDATGLMKRYVQVLITLNGGASAVESYVENHPIIQRRNDHAWGLKKFGDSLDCLRRSDFIIGPAHDYFKELAELFTVQTEVIDQVFPPQLDALTPLLEKLAQEEIAFYVTTLLDESRQRSIECYLKAFAGVYEQDVRFSRSVKPSKAISKIDFTERVSQLVVSQPFEPYVEQYLQDELDFFTNKCEAEVKAWEQRLEDEDTTAEAFYMSNVNRQAAKKDFLSSFKKVVMMPVTVMPFAGSGARTTPEPSSNNLSAPTSRSGTPDPHALRTPSPRPQSMLASSVPPTTELAAKAALMNSRLEGIRSLFSIEVSLTLVHTAKASLERAALPARRQGGSLGEAAREQCGAIFVQLLNILGGRHIKPGFDRAVGHLGSYKPREHHTDHETGPTAENSAPRTIAVQPLTTFLELVNVGDLIQQMVDVFYAQELVGGKLVDRDDFTAAANKEKKRFEQMLDERVAAGLNQGIDVLMTEVEYVCATAQPPTDYNPEAAVATRSIDGTNGAEKRSSTRMDVTGPTECAKRVVEILDGHTRMLVGSTDKNMLDVFNQEVGLRLFTTLCKHLKRQRISVEGSIRLIRYVLHALEAVLQVA
jgi:recyclin-1